MIPVAWAKLLLDLSEHNPSQFSAWPSVLHPPGACFYWKGVPKRALEWIVDNNVPLWPAQGSSVPPTYRQYKEVLVAPPTITAELLDAFASVGLVITQPPQDVYNLAREIRCDQLLTPELAHETILVRLDTCFGLVLLADQPL